MLVVVAVLLGLTDLDRHLLEPSQSILGAKNVERKILGMAPKTLSCPSDVVLGQDCTKLLSFVLQDAQEVDVMREHDHLTS